VRSHWGQKNRTFAPQKGMSVLPPKADMCGATRDVCFGPKADMPHALPREPLVAVIIPYP
jgi:hypothetical protein